MKKCLYCWLFEPIPDTFEDSSDFIPTFSIPFRSARGESVFSLFVSSDGRPQYMRMEIAGLEQEAIPDEMAPMLQAAKEHLLSVLRMTYSAHIQLSPYALWYFVEEGEKYEWGVDLIKQYGELTFDVYRTRRVFVGTFSHREEIRLFVDGFDERIPAQYRYLSFYKILELHFKSKGKWRQKDLEAFLEEHRFVFSEAGITNQSLFRLIEKLRHKCAHIKTSSKKELLGVTHLNQKDLSEVLRILEPFKFLCASFLNSNADGAFEIRLPTGPGFQYQGLQYLKPGSSVTLSYNVGYNVG